VSATPPSIVVDPRNAEQLRAWDGDEGSYWAAHADRFDRGVAAHHDRLLAAAAITSDEHVLDLGCGNGQTTIDAARAAPGGSALGVDLSSPMLAVARERAARAGVENVTFSQVDAQVHDFGAGAFDVVISRTGAMFFSDPPAAFANVGRAVRPGGRIAWLTWQPFEANEWIRELRGALAAGRELPAPPPDAPGPFSLSDPARVHALLTAAGFTDVELEPLHAPMWLGTDAGDADRFLLGMLGWMLQGLDDAARARALDELHGTTTAHETPDGVIYDSAAWIISARR
jgi:SAM-dependent methyltransferase